MCKSHHPMFVAADDTDSMRGNCTTYLASEIIRVVSENGWDIIGYPCLVRLNPAIPWKTRGNGSLVMEFGKGCGQKFFIGNYSGKPLFAYSEKTDEEPDIGFLEKIISPIVERFHDPDDSDPGILISSVKPDYSFYRNGVTRVVGRSSVEAEIERIHATKMEWGCGRGIIGCVCGMAWVPDDFTFELLTYRPSERWGTKRIYNKDTVEIAEKTISSSFNSWDDRHSKVAMVPATPCPVMYGFRGDDPDDVLKALNIIETEPIERWVLFKSNQGTDDHIIIDPPASEFISNSSYSIEGTVVRTNRIKGGHTFADLDTKYGVVTIGIYSPAQEFRFVIDWLLHGDRIRVFGELRDNPRTLNVEKIQVVELVPLLVKDPNPCCPICGKKMSSAGKDQGYRCRFCGTKASVSFSEVHRNIVPGWYEPPTESRRHLSKPLKRMGLEQPVEILRCKNNTFDNQR